MDEPISATGSDLASYCQELARRARAAFSRLGVVSGAQRNDWLAKVAESLIQDCDRVIEANTRDLSRAAQAGLPSSSIDRLRIDHGRLRAIADGVREVAVLPDPVGRVLDSNRRPNGLQVLKISVPLGVIFFIYESRPSVTVDAAALCVKSGNSVILRGGKEAAFSNAALVQILRAALAQCGLPEDAVAQVATTDREAVGHMLRLNDQIDLVIPRGGESLIRRVADEATMPVLKHYKGNCHVYVDQAADLDTAERIVINSKCQRPSVCNAAESLLVHRDIAAAFLPRVAQALRERNVELRGCETTRRYVPDARPATEEDFAEEFLNLIISIKVVDGVESAVEHINKFGSRHTDAIVTNDLASARHFTEAVDSSAVLVNASTRFNDGYELGLGAEIGISTDKFHARGPCGLQELTSYKYVIHGDGQVRET
jgi:glutamate-5-semialdehyde dehydrogenase